MNFTNVINNLVFKGGVAGVSVSYDGGSSNGGSSRHGGNSCGVVHKRGIMVGSQWGVVHSGGNMVDNGGNISGLADVGGGDSLTSGDGDEVLDIGTGDLGDDVAVLNLDGDNLDGGVIHAVLGGDITASVHNGGSHRVSDSGSDDGGGNGVVSISSSSVESISFGISLGFTSVDMVGNGGNRG